MKNDMTHIPASHDSKLILRGIHLGLTEAMKAAIESKAERLFRHEPEIVRIRIDVDRDVRGHARVFTAKGRIEIPGPDLSASVTTENAYLSIKLLIDKLDRMLRKRGTNALRARSADDIRAHEMSPALV